MDSYTFGNSKAAVILSKILTKRNDYKLSSSVTRMLVMYNRGLNQIHKMEDSQIRSSVLHDWFKKFIDKTTKYDTEVKTFLMNVIHTQHKKRLENYK